MSTDPQGDITSRPPGNAAKEIVYHVILFLCAASSVVVTLSIIWVLASNAVGFFVEVPAGEFFLGTEFVASKDLFGLLPLLSGTLLVTVISAFIAIPVGVAAAVYLSEYASERMRSILKPGLEILAGIPTVVYGFFALVYVTPFLRIFGLPLGTFNVLSASIMVGIMIIPMVSSLSEDAISSVPDSLRQAGYGMGATKYDVTTGIVIPAALSGILSSFILALSRAIGETMIVAVAMGLSPRMFDFTDPLSNVFENGQTMTSKMVQVVGSELAGADAGYKSMFALGITLFAITFLMNLISNAIAARYREEYE